jgi:prepilin-type N-terminal cleavage/methylation domain-containing protein
MDKGNGFTFKELLVALAVFVLVVAIMLPALTRIPVESNARTLDEAVRAVGIRGIAIDAGAAMAKTVRTANGSMALPAASNN